MSAQDHFRERITRDVARIMRAVVGAEQPTALDGDIVLRIQDGKLIEVIFPSETAAPVEESPFQAKLKSKK